MAQLPFVSHPTSAMITFELSELQFKVVEGSHFFNLANVEDPIFIKKQINAETFSSFGREEFESSCPIPQVFRFNICLCIKTL